ncbi:MAG: hypothetical protein QMD95_04750 [Candidatus Hodarchaeaceae archaeon]|nr:hypothetical protein [Candidatus Hodarchaeaceae archaeon]
MGSDHKGFFSIDALFAVMLLLLISASFLNMYEGRKQATELMGARLEAKLVGEKLAAAINTVYANGSDFELRVNLPENVGGYSYQITFDNAARQISVENSAWGVVSVGVVCKNVRNFTLGPENLQTLRVYWADNQVKVVSI